MIRRRPGSPWSVGRGQARKRQSAAQGRLSTVVLEADTLGKSGIRWDQGYRVRVVADGLDPEFTFPSGSCEGKLSTRDKYLPVRKVRCREDGSRSRLTLSRKVEYPSVWKLSATLKVQTIPSGISGPAEITLSQSSADIDHVGALGSCRVKPSGTHCRS